MLLWALAHLPTPFHLLLGAPVPTTTAAKVSNVVLARERRGQSGSTGDLGFQVQNGRRKAEWGRINGSMLKALVFAEGLGSIPRTHMTHNQP